MTNDRLDELMDKLEDYVDVRIYRALNMEKKGYDPSPDSRHAAVDALRKVLADILMKGDLMEDK